MCATLLAFVLAAVFAIHPALADISPPQMPPGSNPAVGTVDTKVRMEDEKVVIAIQEEGDLDEMGTARVWAEFHMKNLGNSTKRLMVRFPISNEDGWGNYPEIEDLMVYIDNVSVPTSKISLAGEPKVWSDPIKWTEFEVVFPPGVIVEIEVDYTLYGTGYYPFVTYGYMLETGAGWNGTIGSAEIIVRLPYRATIGNVLLEGNTGWGGTNPGAQLSENEVSWYLEDFEPAMADNISIALIWPSLWQRILYEKNYVYDFPNDGEAWGLLAKYYKEAIRESKGYRTDPGGVFLYQQSVKAYQKTLELLPNDALWHLGYGDLLVDHSGWGYWVNYSTTESREEFLDGLYQIYLAYQLDPDHEAIQSHLNGFEFRDAVVKQNGEYVFIWLTQTPTMPEVDTVQETNDAIIATGQAAETEQAQVTQSTPSPMVIHTVTPEPDPVEPTQAPPAEKDDSGVDAGGKVSLPFCGSTIVFPLVLGFIAAVPAISRRRQSLFRE